MTVKRTEQQHRSAFYIKIRVLGLFIPRFLSSSLKQSLIHFLSFKFVLMMDPLWGLKRRLNEQKTVDNPDHTTSKNFHRSLKSDIKTCLKNVQEKIEFLKLESQL